MRLLKISITGTFAFALLMFANQALAQQETGYSMYTFNMMQINPAYAGSKEQVSLTALYRHQWASFEGAPRVVTLSGHAPIGNKRIALGVSYSNDRVGATRMNELTFNYAYRLPIGPGKLSLGLRASIRNYYMNWTAVDVNEEDDGAFAEDSRILWRPNIGPGIFYYAERFYAGISVPKLINNSLNRNWNLEGTQEIAREHRHVYLNGGVVMDVSDKVKFKPTTLIKYVNNAPVQIDISANFLFYEKLWLGGSYRSSHSAVGMIEYLFDKHFRVGYAYDHEFTDINDHTWGTHEVMIGYEFGIGTDYLTPRKMNYF